MIKALTSVSVTLQLISFHNDKIKTRLCPTCGDSMDLHQPDIGFPARMLWTCENCSTWLLMDIDPVKPQAVLVRLPVYGPLLEAVQDENG